MQRAISNKTRRYAKANALRQLLLAGCQGLVGFVCVPPRGVLKQPTSRRPVTLQGYALGRRAKISHTPAQALRPTSASSQAPRCVATSASTIATALPTRATSTTAERGPLDAAADTGEGGFTNRPARVDTTACNAGSQRKREGGRNRERDGQGGLKVCDCKSSRRAMSLS